MKSLISFFVRQKLFGDLISVFVVIIGVTSLLLIRREVFPNVSFDIVTVQTLFPGASPEEVEKLVTNPIEQDMQEVDGIKKLRSTSIEGRSYIIAQLDPDQTTEAKGKSDIKDVVDRFQKPEGVEDPLVTSIESKQSPIIEIHISSEMPDLELRSVAKELEKVVEAIPGVAKVVHKGLRDLEIRIEADPGKLQRYSISLDELISALKLQNRSIPAGVIEAKEDSIQYKERIVRTVGEYKTLEDVQNTVVRSNELGRAIRVKDVAKVTWDLVKATTLNATNGRSALVLTVLKKEKADAITVVDKLKETMKGFEAKYSGKVFTDYTNDFSEFIRRRISILGTNLLLGLILVTITLSLFLPWRVALVCSSGILLSFLGTMSIFNMQGYTINLISLLGLIIVSGMLVDDAVVVSDNVVRYMEDGMDPEDAAIKGTSEIWTAISASVLTTVVAFLPMMFMSGIFGKFVKQIPLGVVIALLLSLIEALFILPMHIVHYAKVHETKGKVARNKISRSLEKTRSFWDNKVVPRYVDLVKIILRRRYWVVAGVGTLFIASVFLASSAMRFVLFPPEGIETFFVRIKAPTGVNLETTRNLMKPVEEVVSQLASNELQDYTLSVGLIQNDPNDPNTQRGSEYAQLVVFLTPETSRDRTAAEIIEDLRAKIAKPEGVERITFDRVKPGPPVGKPISLGVRGQTYADILPAVEALKKRIAELNGVTDVTDNYVPGKKEFQIHVDAATAAAAGLTVTQVGTTVRAAFDGIVATTIQEIDDEVDVRVSFPKEARADFETLGFIKIPNNRGNLIPLNRIARIEQANSIAVFEHEGNQREVKVSSDLDTNVASASQVNDIIRTWLPDLAKEFPSVRIDFGGEDEDTQESLRSLLRAFGVAFMSIFLILVLTFQQLLQPFLVILTIPLGIIAVIWTLFIAGMPFSFMAMLGIIALAGVIVNNAIVMIDFVNQARKEGMDRFKSIEEAARIRLRPIFLTTATTVAGLLPTAHGIGGLDKFVVPIAMSLGYGLMFGAFLTAFVFPAAIAVLDDLHEFFEKKFATK